MERAKNRNINGYKEIHHIIPLCINGDNLKSNLVELTPEEHFLAHRLLVKIYPKNKKILYAAWMMKNTRKFSNNKSYGWLKREYIEILKERSKQPNFFIPSSLGYKHKQSFKDEQTLRWKKNNPNKIYWTKENRLIRSHKYKGKNNPNYGKQPLLGKKCFYNPVTNQEKYFEIGKEHPGFILGSIRNTHSKKGVDNNDTPN
jgi:hypothetical protein